MKTLLYCFVSLSIVLSACSVNKSSQYSYGGKFNKVQDKQPVSSNSAATNVPVDQTYAASTELLESPGSSADLEVKKQDAKPRTSELKKKWVAAKTAKKALNTSRYKNAPKSEEDWFAAIMIITAIVALIVLAWGLLAIGVSVLGVILILVFLLGFSAIVGSL